MSAGELIADQANGHQYQVYKVGNKDAYLVAVERRGPIAGDKGTPLTLNQLHANYSSEMDFGPNCYRNKTTGEFVEIRDTPQGPIAYKTNDVHAVPRSQFEPPRAPLAVPEPPAVKAPERYTGPTDRGATYVYNGQEHAVSIVGDDFVILKRTHDQGKALPRALPEDFRTNYKEMQVGADHYYRKLDDGSMHKLVGSPSGEYLLRKDVDLVYLAKDTPVKQALPEVAGPRAGKPEVVPAVSEAPVNPGANRIAELQGKRDRISEQGDWLMKYAAALKQDLPAAQKMETELRQRGLEKYIFDPEKWPGKTPAQYSKGIAKEGGHKWRLASMATQEIERLQAP